MVLLYRVLNEYDIACNPLENGLASKKLIYDLTKSYLETNEKEILSGLTEKEKDKYYKANMTKYINTHQHKLKKMIDKRGKEISRNLAKVKEYDPKSWTYLLYYLSTINSHLTSGTKIYTDWISTTNNFNSIRKYYQEQKTHKVAVLTSSSNGLLDDNTIVLDLSSKEVIKEILLMLNKKITDDLINEIMNKIKQSPISYLDVLYEESFSKTSEKFMGYNFAVSDNETCIYRYFPSENIISVLEALQIDLIAFKMFNFEYLKLTKEQQIQELYRLKEKLKKRIIKQNDPYMLYIFEKMYLENKNINLIKENIFDGKKINYTRMKILKLAKDIPNIQINR